MLHRTVGISTGLARLNRETFAEYAANGIGAFELSVGFDHYPELDIPRIAAEARECGVDTWSFHLPFAEPHRADISSTDEAFRARTVETEAEWLRRAAGSGFRHAVIHPSSEPVPEEGRAAHMDSACRSLAQLGAVADAAGIVLAVEDLPRSCLGNCSGDMLQLLGAWPSLRVCFDTNHLLGEDFGSFLDAVGDRVATLHVSDYDFENERHWLPGEGKNDWPRLMDKLDAIGYTGTFLYEVSMRSATIERPRPLCAADFRTNADELEARAALTKRGTPYPDLGLWGPK